MALPSLIGAALARVPPDRAGAAAGILTTAQQFGVASGVAVIGAVFYARHPTDHAFHSCIRMPADR